jgi:hypothetical protein
MILIYSRTPLIRINWDGQPFEYAENPDNRIFSLKISYIGSFKWEKKVYQQLFGARCWWLSWFRHCATSRKDTGSIPQPPATLRACLDL